MYPRILLLLLLAVPLAATAGDADELRQLLNEFLAGATIGSVATHERFWSDDLVYTSSDGSRTGKAEIVERMRAAEPERRPEPPVVYTAEDVEVRVYGDAAVVAFRLVGTSRGDEAGRSEYFNTGTFLKRDGQWRAVAWQATKIPRSE